MKVPNSQLRKTGLALGAVGIGGFAADYLFNIGLSRLLDAHAYGDFRVAHAFASFAGVAVLLGGDRAAPMVMAGPLERGDRAEAWEYLRFYLRLGAAFSLAVIAFTWAGSALHLGSHDPQDHHALAWVVVSVPVIAFGAMTSRALQSASRQVLAAMPWRVAFPLLKLALLGLVAWAAGGIDVHGAITVAVAVTILVAAWQWRELRRLELPTLRRDPSAAEPRRWLASSLPMMGAFLVVLALNQSDLYFLELLGEENEVGHYAAAGTSAHFLLILQATVVGLVAPRLRPALDAGSAATVYSDGQRLLLGALLPIALLVGLAASPILSLFGPGFPAAVDVLRLLLVGNVAWATAALATLWLQYTGRATQVLVITVVTLAVDSGLNLLLIPRFGMLGAALGTAFTMTAAAAILLVMRLGSAAASSET